MSEDSASRETAPVAVTPEPDMVAFTSLAMRFLDTAAPPAAKPAADSPMATESMVEASVADRDREPAVTVEAPASSSTMEALIVFSISLMVRDSCAAAKPEPATPPTKLRMSASEVARRLAAPVLVRLEPDTSAVMELVMRL